MFKTISDEDISKMQKMRIEGKTFKEIGKEFGFSRQRAYQILAGYKPYVCDKGLTGIKYPKIKEYVIENYHSVNDFYDANNFKEFCSITNFIGFLRGENRVSVELIKAILKVIGASFEEVFYDGQGYSCQ